MRISALFRQGHNSLLPIEWELYDTEPADEWRKLTAKAHEIAPEGIHDVRIFFCESDEQARSYWGELQELLINYDIRESKYFYEKLTARHTEQLIERVDHLFERQDIGDTEAIDKLRKASKKLQAINFWLLNRTYNKHGAKISHGEIHIMPAQMLIMPFKPQFKKHLTTIIEPGTLYAALHYEKSSWHDVVKYPDDKVADAIEAGEFGPPTGLSNAFYVPFSKGIIGIDAYLINIFKTHHSRLGTQWVQPAFSSIGEIPVGKLLTEFGKFGNPKLSDLNDIGSLMKVEVY